MRKHVSLNWMYRGEKAATSFSNLAEMGRSSASPLQVVDAVQEDLVGFGLEDFAW